MKVHSIKTDNFEIDKKIYLRSEATKHLEELRVLDLFAGKNKLWSNFMTTKYFGIEKEKGKGRNLNADNLRIIPVMDLSEFNIIDCDSYGIPFNQMQAIFDNPTLLSGTVIIYTCITNAMSAMNKKCLQYFHLEKIYRKCHVLFNSKEVDFFHSFLYDHDIHKLMFYNAEKTSFYKEYGYFVIK